ncbi:hypothetical protein [Nocardia sp. NBC_01009]|nr:hypothetical protein OHA42_11075 [Nocardia sp. NBC_01009]
MHGYTAATSPRRAGVILVVLGVLPRFGRILLTGGVPTSKSDPVPVPA